MTEEEKLEEELTGKSAKTVTASYLSEPAPSIISLPSKGILYRNDPSLSEIHEGNISVRPMTLRELELFLRPELLESGTLIDAIFKKCVKSNIDTRMLLTSDRTYILIWIRVQSFGSKYKFKFQCAGCRRTISWPQDLGALPVKTLDEIHGAHDKEGRIIQSSVKKIQEPFAFQLPLSKLTVKYRLSRGIDESEKSRDAYYRRLKKEQGKNGNGGMAMTRNAEGKLVMRNVDPTEFQHDEDTAYIENYETTSLLENLLKQVVSIDGVPEEQIENALNNMVAGDITALQQKMYDSDSGIDMRITVTCPDKVGCGHRSEITVPFTESFFRSSL